MNPIFPLRPKSNSLLREWTGPLTEELVQNPSRHGLGKVPQRLQPDATTSSVCGYCATGCSLNVHLKDGEAINLSAKRDYPVNLGMACPKGWEALAPLSAADRAITPLLRNESGKLVACDWDNALKTFSARFKSIQDQYGKESIAWIGTGQVSNEDFASLGVLGKFGMGIVHADGNTRQCMATAVTAYKQSFGFDAPPYTYQDFEESDVLVFVGSNLCITHPIMWQRVLRNRRNPEIVVVDPRFTETAMAGTRHFAIQPKSDLVLFYALAAELIRRDALDHAYIEDHTSGFENFKRFVTAYSLTQAEQVSGVAASEILWLADQIASGKRVSFWWTMGVNQSYEGTRVAQALINICLMTGNIGKPGTGPNSITGQCNAMGSRLFSNTTNLLGGHSFSEEAHREKVAAALDIDVSRIPTDNSLAYDEILEGIDSGKIRGLWFVATNPAHSWPFHEEFKKRMDKLEFIVVQDMYLNTETVEHADLVLPAAGWGEKDGTFINSERRVGVTRKVRRAPGQALSDFYIFKLIAHYWGCEEVLENWDCPEDVFRSLMEVTRGQGCDMSGMEGYERLTREGGIQWPLAKGETLTGKQRRLFEDGRFFYADGRARFKFEASRPMPEGRDEQYPFILLTGRGTSSQWHTQTRTSKSDVLRKLYPQKVYFEINALDAERLGIRSQQLCTLESRRGELQATAHVCHTVKSGQVFLPMHYKEVNRLTRTDVDPYSHQPSFKACAINVISNV